MSYFQLASRRTAAPCASGGAASVGSGSALGLVVVDSNRLAVHIGTARGLRKQSGTAH